MEQDFRDEGTYNVFSLDTFLFKEFLKPSVVFKYLSLRRSLPTKFKKLFKEYIFTEEFRKKLVFGGVNFAKVYDLKTEEMILRDWPEFTFLVQKLQKVFMKKKPVATITWNDVSPFERICTVLGKESGKTIAVQHGLFPTEGKSRFVKGIAPVQADVLAVWGDFFKDSLLKKGVPEEKICVTGSPKLDALVKKKFDSIKFRKENKIKDEKIIVFAPDLDGKIEDVKEVCKVVEGIKKVRLFIKIHPVDNLNRYADINGVTIIQKGDLHELLNAADVVIIHISSVGVEAMALGKVVICYGEAVFDKMDYKSMDVPCVHTPEELKKLLLTPKRVKVDKICKMDGNTMERIMELIKS